MWAFKPYNLIFQVLLTDGRGDRDPGEDTSESRPHAGGAWGRDLHNLSASSSASAAYEIGELAGAIQSRTQTQDPRMVQIFLHQESCLRLMTAMEMSEEWMGHRYILFEEYVSDKKTRDLLVT